MTDASLNAVLGKPPVSSTKPRLSLLSSRQSGIRLKSSEELPDKPSSLNLNDVIRRAEMTTSEAIDTPEKIAANLMERLTLRETDTSTYKGEEHETDPQNVDRIKRLPFREQDNGQGSDFATIHQQILNFGKQSSFAIDDLFRILALLKSDLQTKEIALNSFKTEQLKRLINPIEIKKSTLADAYMKLQDRIKAKEKGKKSNVQTNTITSASDDINEKTDQANCNTSSNISNQSDTSNTQTTDECAEASTARPFECINNDANEEETLNIMIALLELLDRHPLLALPRDAMYCLDYACNDVSTKNYLNLKIQGLESLIDLHRRFRYYLGERLKRSEQRYIDLTLKLEQERNQKIESERSSYGSGGRVVLLKHIDQLKEELEREKSSKHAIVMTLLNELTEERNRNATLESKVIDLEKKLHEAKPTSKPSTPSATAPVKPRVPAKPAQLLDRNRAQTKPSR